LGSIFHDFFITLGGRAFTTRFSSFEKKLERAQTGRSIPHAKASKTIKFLAIRPKKPQRSLKYKFKNGGNRHCWA